MMGTLIRDDKDCSWMPRLLNWAELIVPLALNLCVHGAFISIRQPATSLAGNSAL